MFSYVFAAEAASSAPQPSFLEQSIPFVFIILIFYLFLIRPQQKRQKKHQEFLGSLKRGDEVVTQGGLLGVVEGLTDDFVTLGISEGVKVRVLRNQVSISLNELKKQSENQNPKASGKRR